MMLATSKALVYSRLLGRDSRQLVCLRYHIAERCAVVGLAVDSSSAHNPIVSPSRHEHHFATELVALVNFALGDALRVI